MTRPEIVAFAAALNDAFTRQQMESLLLSLNRKFSDYVGSNQPFPRELERLVTAAKSQGWVPQLVAEAVRQNPGNRSIKHFLATYPNWNLAI